MAIRAIESLETEDKLQHRGSKFMIHHATNPALEECIKKCLDCHHICLETAMNHCLETGGKHTEPAHFRLMMNCAEICQTSANFMLSGSDLHHLTCGVCAEVCRRCADDCERIGDMDECVQACRECADSCDRMAGKSSGAARLPGTAVPLVGPV